MAVSKSRTVAVYHTHGDYSKVGDNGEPERVEKKSQDEYKSDKFSEGAGGDKDNIAYAAELTRESRQQYGERFKGYIGTPSGRIKVYTPPQ